MDTRLLTGYNDSTLLLLNPFDPRPDLTTLLDKYLDTMQCSYDDASIGPIETSALQAGSSAGSTPGSMLHRSTLFGRLPWLTSLVDNFESPAEPIKGAINSLQADFVQALQSTDENSRAYCGVLKGEIPGTSTASHAHVASRLLTIRLLDIYSSVNDSKAGIEDPIHPSLVNIRGLKGISLDWVETISHARAVLQPANGSNLATQKGLKRPITSAQSTSRHLYLFSERNERNSTSFQISANIGLACLMIRRVLQGRLDSLKPEDVAEEFGEDVAAPLTGWTSLPKPLELAIAAGPLILFSSKKLTANRFSRARLTALWIQTGKCRNSRVWSVEQKIWKGLFEIAQGGDIEAGILQMISEVPNEFISLAARSWYNLAEHGMEPEGTEPDLFSFLQMDVQRADFMSTFTAAINGCNQSTHVKEHTPDLTIDPALLSLFPKRLPAAVTTVPLLSPQSTQATQLQSAGNKSTPWPLAPPAVWTTISLSPPQLSRATQLKLDGNPLMPGHLAPPAPPPAGTFLLQTIIGETSPQTGLVSDVRDAVECNPTPEKHDLVFNRDGMGVNLHQPVAVAFEENRDMIVDDPDEQDTVFDGEENSGNVINSVRGQLLDGDEPGRWVTHLDFLDKQSMLVDHSPILHRMVVDNDTALDPMVIDDNAAQHDMVTEDQPGQQDPPPNTKSLRQRPWKPLPSAKSIGKRKAPHASCIRESKRSKPDEAALAQHAETTNLDRSLDLIGLNELFAEESIDLDVSDTPKRYLGEQIQGYDPTGVIIEFRPVLHVEEDLDLLQRFDSAVRRSFVNGLPLHVSDPVNSAFCAMTKVEFERKAVGEIQGIMRRRHILITDMDSPALDFDPRGLSSLTTLSTVTDIQDQSIHRNSSRMGYKCCLRKGTVRSLLGCSQTGGKILNTLHLPMPERGLGDFKFSTDSAAWTCTKGAANCSAEQVPPLADIRWGFAATAGALHWWRLASNGFGSYFDVKAGLQWCIVGRPGHGHEFESFSDVSTFLAGRYSEKEPNVKHWVLEAVILPPCTRLIMRPNTPHVVYTTKDTICHGGYFYVTAAMQDTMFGIVHGFIAGCVLTNTDKPGSFLILRRIAMFYHDVLVTKRLQDDEYEAGHVPPLTDFNSVLDLFTLCNLVILMNVLDPRTYLPASAGNHELRKQHDLNSIPTLERCEISHARGRCLDIFKWFFSVYEIIDRETSLRIDGYSRVAMAYLAHQASTIVDYKRRACADGLDDGGSFSVGDVEHQIKLCFEGYPNYVASTRPPSMDVDLSLVFPEAQRYDVRRLEKPHHHQALADFLMLGTTAGDSRLLNFLSEHQETSQ